MMHNMKRTVYVANPSSCFTDAFKEVSELSSRTRRTVFWYYKKVMMSIKWDMTEDLAFDIYVSLK